VDPYEEFRRELKNAYGKWYVIHSYAGFEKRVKQNIENRKVSMAMEDYVFQVEVPMEDVVEIKNGQRKLVTRVRIPGYVLVRMDLNEDSWSVVRPVSRASSAIRTTRRRCVSKRPSTC
jgi:transcriptional antiterminator NusG